MKTTSWKKSLQKSANYFLAIITALLFLGCSARKTENTKVKKLEKLESAKLDFSGSISSNTQMDKSIIFVREIYEKGEIKEKQTTTQNNKLDQKIKIEYRYIKQKQTIYKTITLKNKKTQKEAVSNWVWFVGLFLVFLFAILKWNKELFRFQN
jgi:uncharacterized protein YcfL